MPARKRTASEVESDSTPRRSSRRSSAIVKSSYFESDKEDEVEADELPPKKRGRPSKKLVKKVESESEEEQYLEEEDFEEDEEGTEEEEQEVLPTKKAQRGRPSKKAKEESEEEQYKDETENNEEDEKEDEDEDDEDGPRNVKILPLEKLRDEGGVPYEDHKLHKNTLLFLRDLKANNKRPWLKSHDGEYRRALKDWVSFVEKTTETVIEVDETIPELPPKDLIFRIYRDARFSKDPTPYKPHFSAAWSRTGRKGPYAFYYIHCEPKVTMMAGGLWHPEAASVAKLRHSIDTRPQRWRRALNDPLFRKAFFPGVKESAGPEAMVKAFVATNQENALKKKPMGFEVTHRDIELLKLRNYSVSTSISDDVLVSENAQARIAEIARGLVGYVTFLNSIVMPDPNLDDEDETDDEEEDEAGESGDAEEEEDDD